MVKRFILAVVLLTLVLGLAACGTKAPETVAPTPGEATGLDGQAILLEKCTVCHSADVVNEQSLDAVGWASLIDDMIAKGAKLTDAEAAALADYLALQ